MASKLRWAAVASIAQQAKVAAEPGSPSLSRRVAALPGLVRDVLNGRYLGMSQGKLALVALALLYVVSPADLLPEAVLPLVGITDDALVIAWIAAALNRETDSYLRWQHNLRNTVPSTVVYDHPRY